PERRGRDESYPKNQRKNFSYQRYLPLWRQNHITVVNGADIPREGYMLTVAPEEVEIKARDSAGAFYAGQTLEELALEGDIPCGCYEDAPKFPLLQLYAGRKPAFLWRRRNKKAA
ncbi:MAG: glycoside hydrolase family 20 zincin-like fold domain-containing protein, partial [Desulfovibrionaceae bacterium]|nr:glycoside hydrolase family 20 zincin-like fold domain-containing protein [Desulfovibrionaceae bacterium]